MFFLYVNTILFLYCYTVHEKHCKMMDMINKKNFKKNATGKTGKMAQKNPCQGKHREFGNFAKT